MQDGMNNRFIESAGELLYLVRDADVIDVQRIESAVTNLVITASRSLGGGDSVDYVHAVGVRAAVYGSCPGRTNPWEVSA
jgi:hypothetical protein